LALGRAASRGGQRSQGTQPGEAGENEHEEAHPRHSGDLTASGRDRAVHRRRLSLDITPFTWDDSVVHLVKELLLT